MRRGRSGFASSMRRIADSVPGDYETWKYIAPIQKVVDAMLGKEQLLSYEEVTTRTAEKVAKHRDSAIGIAAIGASLILFGGLARLVRGSSHGIAEPNPDRTIGAVLWVLLYGIVLMVMLTEPAILHRAFGTEAFHLPIE